MRITRFRIAMMLMTFLAAAGATVVVLVRHEPDFYRRAAVAGGPQRLEISNEFFVRDFVPFVANFDGGREEWKAKFTQEQINSFFEEDFIRFGDADYFRKIGIVNPRVEFTDDVIRIGFRYGTGWWSTVLSYDLKIWLAKNEVNVIAIEIQRRRAGAMSIPTQQIFKELKDVGRRQNIEVEWYRHNGNPVAIVKFQSDRPRPTAQLYNIKIEDGAVHLEGQSIDSVQIPPEEPLKKTPEVVSQTAP